MCLSSLSFFLRDRIFPLQEREKLWERERESFMRDKREFCHAREKKEEGEREGVGKERKNPPPPPYTLMRACKRARGEEEEGKHVHFSS